MNKRKTIAVARVKLISLYRAINIITINHVITKGRFPLGKQTILNQNSIQFEQKKSAMRGIFHRNAQPVHSCF